MNKPKPLFTIPHLIIAVVSVAAITLVVLFAVNPEEIANKVLDEKLSKMATSEDPTRACTIFDGCKLLPSLVNNTCFIPRSFYHKRKAILENKVFEYNKESKKMTTTNICSSKAADWEALHCFVCL
ncbi:MAG: hypothetical protein AAB546_03810 [Patescibacteria group bacterium]